MADENERSKCLEGVGFGSLVEVLFGPDLCELELCLRLCLPPGVED